jgi:Cu/Ag efflux pump CusA
MARFFIDRPIFAWVIAIVVMLAGLLALTRLPISRYPDIAPPSVTVNASYPGASAATVENSVTQVIEQAMTGLDGLQYMSSTSDSNGSVAVTMTFANGTNPDVAQVQVQNKLQVAMAQLPQIVQQQGLRVDKARAGFLQVVAFVSSDGSMDRQDIADYVSSNIVDQLSRVPGVGSVQVFGGKYAMRIWLDPVKLATYRLVPGDVVGAARRPSTASRSMPPSPRRTACRRRSSSAPSSCAATRTARCCASATSPGWNWVRRTTASSAATTASRRRALPSCWPRAPMRWPPPMRWLNASISCGRAFRPA